MPYSKIQYIAYDVPTLHLRAPGAFDAGRPLPAVQHMTNADAKARIQRMRDVAVQAASLSGLGGADTLKIFVAPEFYFRENRYSYRDIQTVTNIYSALMSAFQVNTFNDWLIIPGTIFWSQDGPADDNAGPSDKTAFFNTVMMIRGGAPPNADLTPAEKASKVPIISNGSTNQKALMSPIDFALGKAGQAARLWDGAVNANFAPIISDWAWQKAHVFQVKGVQTGTRNINFGIEVCLEHADTYTDPKNPKVGVTGHVGALRSALDEWKKNEKEDPPAIDVHIITSCGMDIIAKQVCARANGYVILCDGQGTQKLQKVTTARNGATAAVLGPVIAPTSTTAATQAVPGGGTQQIKIYPAQTL